MSNPASVILDQASRVLQDNAKTRWPDSELIDWLNEGIRLVCSSTPTAYSWPESLNIAEGVRQELPDNNITLLNMHRNLGSGFVIRPVKRRDLDALDPSWPLHAQSTDVEHYMYDAQSPNVFLVYPPNDGNGQVEVTFAGVPPAVTCRDDELPLKLHFNPPLLDYTLYRAYNKDAEYAPNAELALQRYQSFMNVINAGAQRPVQ